MSGVTRTVEAKNKKWSIDSLADGAQATITVEAGWKNEYVSRIKGAGGNGSIDDTADDSAIATDLDTTDQTDTSGADEAGTILGRMSYSSPPSDAVAEDS